MFSSQYILDYQYLTQMVLHFALLLQVLHHHLEDLCVQCIQSQLALL